MRQTNKLRWRLSTVLFPQILALSFGHFPLQASSSEGTFQVYLVDDKTGQPVERAFVVLYRMFELTLARIRKEGRIEPSFSAERLEGGVYRFENLKVGKYLVSIKAEGYAFKLLPITLQGPGARREVIWLTPPGYVRGLVVDNEGNSIPDAKLRIAYLDEEFLSLQRQSPHSIYMPGSARTNEFGEYFIDGYVRPGWRFVVEAGSKDFLPVLSEQAIVGEGEVATVNVVLSERGNDVEGRVVDDQGQPVEGEGVALESLDKPILELSGGLTIGYGDPLFSIIANQLFTRYHKVGETQSDGTFSIPGMAPGRYRITVSFVEGYEEYRDQVEVSKGGNNFFELVLKRKSPD